ncbi:MAG: restriction endonuclease subunit S [Candidatus Omnitrophica bacterium]|nr:restriction endonuclease subunit S [Candidatus Omnitrophota bacterium]
MELRKGYKQTDVGVIPEDWEVSQVGRTCTQVTTGKLDANAMVENGAYRFYTCAKNYYLIDSYAFDCEALLISGNGAHVGYVHYYNGKFNAYQRTYVLSGFKSAIKYVQHYLEKNFRDRIQVEVRAGGTPYITRDTITESPIPLPPTIIEQESIATALSDVDALLDGLDRLITKKRDLKQAAMQQLLTGQTRLPGFEGEWETKRLGAGCAVITKGTTPTSVGKQFKESGITFLKVEALSDNGKFIADQFAFIDSDTHRLLKRSQLQSGDLLISIAGALGRTGIVPSIVLPANTNQALAIVRLSKESGFDGTFLYFSIRAERTQRHFNTISLQGAQANLSLQQISDIPIWCPRKDEQTAIATVLSDMDAEIVTLEQRRNKTKDIKQAMMQELLTGRTRLVTPEAAHV